MKSYYMEIRGENLDWTSTRVFQHKNQDCVSIILRIVDEVFVWTFNLFKRRNNSVGKY